MDCNSNHLDIIHASSLALAFRHALRSHRIIEYVALLACVSKRDVHLKLVHLCVCVCVCEGILLGCIVGVIRGTTEPVYTIICGIFLIFTELLDITLLVSAVGPQEQHYPHSISHTPLLTPHSSSSCSSDDMHYEPRAISVRMSVLLQVSRLVMDALLVGYPFWISDDNQSYLRIQHVYGVAAGAFVGGLICVLAYYTLPSIRLASEVSYFSDAEAFLSSSTEEEESFWFSDSMIAVWRCLLSGIQFGIALCCVLGVSYLTSDMYAAIGLVTGPALLAILNFGHKLYKLVSHSQKLAWVDSLPRTPHVVLMCLYIGAACLGVSAFASTTDLATM